MNLYKKMIFRLSLLDPITFLLCGLVVVLLWATSVGFTGF